MYRGEDVLKVRGLFAKGLSKSAIARKLGIDRKTVSRLLGRARRGAISGSRNPSVRPSSIPTKNTGFSPAFIVREAPREAIAKGFAAL